jgi:transcriptional regulator with XRE-family HTH domain
LLAKVSCLLLANMKTMRQILGQQVAQARKNAGMSVLDLVAKSGTSRQSIYDIEAGKQNLTADQFQKLMNACGVSPENWLAGIDDVPGPDIPREHHNLFRLLGIIVRAQNLDLIHGVQVSLDALSDKALRLSRKSRAAPSPTLREGQEVPELEGATTGSRRRK